MSTDAQIEALQSRIEVLSDDVTELRADNDYAETAFTRMNENAARMQRELETVCATLFAHGHCLPGRRCEPARATTGEYDDCGAGPIRHLQSTLGH